MHLVETFQEKRYNVAEPRVAPEKPIPIGLAHVYWVCIGMHMKFKTLGPKTLGFISDWHPSWANGFIPKIRNLNLKKKIVLEKDLEKITVAFDEFFYSLDIKCDFDQEEIAAKVYFLVDASWPEAVHNSGELEASIRSAKNWLITIETLEKVATDPVDPLFQTQEFMDLLSYFKSAEEAVKKDIKELEDCLARGKPKSLYQERIGQLIDRIIEAKPIKKYRVYETLPELISTIYIEGIAENVSEGSLKVLHSKYKSSK